jgi:dynein heavy chain
MWTEGVARAFEELEGGSESAMKDYLNTVLIGIKHLIERVREDLKGELRGKIITIITIDVHERDVVEKFVNLKIQDS